MTDNPQPEQSLTSDQDFATTERVLTELNALAEPHGEVIYAILLRNAGWGIQWHDLKREIEKNGVTEVTMENWRAVRDNWRAGLVIHRYYRTITEMLSAERQRLLDQECP